ncbi:MAG: SHD1 domain-containing protein [Akkermansiaceae bacterium]
MAYAKFRSKYCVIGIPVKQVKAAEPLLSPLTLTEYRWPAGIKNKTLPIAVVTDPTQTVSYGVFDMKSLGKRETYKEIGNRIKAVKAGQKNPHPEQPWLQFITKDKPINGNFEKMIDNEKFSFQPRTLNQNNKNPRKPKEVELKTLSKGARDYVKAMAAKSGAGAGAGVADAKDDEDKPERKMESWQSATSSKTIQAQFVSLKDGQITLKQANGKVVTFDLSRLSDKSQQRAKELAGE